MGWFMDRIRRALGGHKDDDQDQRGDAGRLAPIEGPPVDRRDIMRVERREAEQERTLQRLQRDLEIITRVRRGD